MTRSVSPENEIYSQGEEYEQQRTVEVAKDACIQALATNFDLSSKLTWSDDDRSDMDDFSIGAIYDSVLAIRKEVSNFNALLAVDQLETLKAEIASTKRELELRNEEVDELRELVNLKEARICTLELECDLFKAESCNTKDGTQHCLSTMSTFDSLSESSTNRTDSQKEDDKALTTDQSPSTCSETSSESSKSNKAKHNQASPYEVARYLDPPSCESSDRSSTSISTTSTPARPVPTQPLLFPLREGISKREDDRSLKTMTKPKQQRSRNRSFPFCRHSCHRKPIVSIIQEDEGTMEETTLHMTQISQQMETSIALSEELRRRITLLSRYYESVIAELLKKLVDMQSDRDQGTMDFTEQIKILDRERKHAIDRAESVLRQNQELQDKLAKPKTKGDRNHVKFDLTQHIERQSVNKGALRLPVHDHPLKDEASV